MTGLAHQIISGIASGSIYAAVALALVMIYQSTHHINFAQGEMATLSTYLCLTMINAGFSYWGAFLIAVALSFVMGVATERILMRPMMNAPPLSVVGVFIGLLLVINAFDGWVWDYTIKSFPSPFGGSNAVLGGFISPHELGETAVTLLVLFAVYLFFRHTTLG
ncbi:MAG: branched-chain amino acid ABC transporter permease, partial [Acetobacteraceae bacterium]